MSRNVREEENKVLQILRNELSEERLTRIENMERHIFFSPTTYDVVESAYISESNIIDNNRILFLKYKEKTYICMKRGLFCPGVLKVENEEDDQEVIFGIGVLMINHRIINVKSEVSQYKIFDRFFGWDEEKRVFL